MVAANDQAGSNGESDALSSTETQSLLAKARAVAGQLPAKRSIVAMTARNRLTILSVFERYFEHDTEFMA